MFIHENILDSTEKNNVESVPVEQLKTALQREAEIVSRFAGEPEQSLNYTHSQNEASANRYAKLGRHLLENACRCERHHGSSNVSPPLIVDTARFPEAHDDTSTSTL